MGIGAYSIWGGRLKPIVLHTRPVMHAALLSFWGSFEITSHPSVREGLLEWI